MAGSVEQLRGHEHPVNPEWQAQRVTRRDKPLGCNRAVIAA